MTTTLQVQGFLSDLPPIQLEGFGSAVYGSELVTILHQGSLTSTEYFPSIILRINLETGAWSTRSISSEVGFPKATALFDTEQQTVYFIDHDKENEQTRLADGSWRGGYLYAVNLTTAEPIQLEVNNTREFWHDLKLVDGRVVALAFDRDLEFSLLDVTLGNKVNLPNVGSFGQAANNLIVSPYGANSQFLSLIDNTTFTLKESIDLGAAAYIHETLILSSVDGHSRALLFQESFMNGTHYYLKDEVVVTFIDSIEPRTIFNVDLNADSIIDLIVGTNNGTQFFLNDGYGRFVEIEIPELEGHFLIHPVNEKIVSFDWPSASPRINLTDISALNLKLSNDYVEFLKLASEDFEMISSPQGITIIQHGFAQLFQWSLFLNSTVTAKGGVWVHEKFKAISTHALDDHFLDPFIFLPTFDEDLRELNFPDSVLRVQTFQSFRALDLDGATSAGGIYRLYKATFNREPDAGGLGYWIAQADAGTKDAVRMAEDFVWSQEFQDLYNITTTDNYGTGTDVEALVTGFYENVLGRTPDQGGLDFYTGVIESKERTVGRVLAEISDSQENYDGTIELIANGILYDPWVG